MAWKTLTFFAVFSSIAGVGHPCSVMRIPSAAELVKEAEAIILVRTEGLASQPGKPGSLAGSQTQVQFRVVEVMKGNDLPTFITFNGSLADDDDRNDRPVPYDFVRPGGRHGNCFALDYREGAEYLLLLKRAAHQAYAQPNDLTPYWAPLAPTNEQVAGTGDPWVSWVRSTAAK